MTDDAIRHRWLSFDYLATAQQDQVRRAWREPVAVGLDLASGPDFAAVTFGGRRQGRTAALERHARQLLAAGHRVIEATTAHGLREVTIGPGGELVRGPGDKSIQGRSGRIEFGTAPRD